MAFCPTCGHEVTDTQKFCPECSTKLRGPGAATGTPPADVSNAVPRRPGGGWLLDGDGDGGRDDLDDFFSSYRRKGPDATAPAEADEPQFPTRRSRRRFDPDLSYEPTPLPAAPQPAPPVSADTGRPAQAGSAQDALRQRDAQAYGARDAADEPRRESPQADVPRADGLDPDLEATRPKAPFRAPEPSPVPVQPVEQTGLPAWSEQRDEPRRETRAPDPFAPAAAAGSWGGFSAASRDGAEVVDGGELAERDAGRDERVGRDERDPGRDAGRDESPRESFDEVLTTHDGPQTSDVPIVARDFERTGIVHVPRLDDRVAPLPDEHRHRLVDDGAPSPFSAPQRSPEEPVDAWPAAADATRGMDAPVAAPSDEPDRGWSPDDDATRAMDAPVAAPSDEPVRGWSPDDDATRAMGAPVDEPTGDSDGRWWPDDDATRAMDAPFAESRSESDRGWSADDDATRATDELGDHADESRERAGAEGLFAEWFGDDDVDAAHGEAAARAPGHPEPRGDDGDRRATYDEPTIALQRSPLRGGAPAVDPAVEAQRPWFEQGLDGTEQVGSSGAWPGAAGAAGAGAAAGLAGAGAAAGARSAAPGASAPTYHAPVGRSPYQRDPAHPGTGAPVDARGAGSGPAGPRGPRGGGPGGSGPGGSGGGLRGMFDGLDRTGRRRLLTIAIALAGSILLIISAVIIGNVIGARDGGNVADTPAPTDVATETADEPPAEPETPAGPPPAVADPNFQAVAFQSETANLRCIITPEIGVACQHSNPGFVPPATVCTSTGTSGAVVGLDSNGYTWPCLEEDIPYGQDVLPYGESIHAGEFACSMDAQTGVTCFNAGGDIISLEFQAGIGLSGRASVSPQPTSTLPPEA